MRLLDASFKYVPASHTNVATTWKRFGYRPTTEAERRAQQSRAAAMQRGQEPLTLSGRGGAAQRSRQELVGRRKPAQARGEQRVPQLKLASSE